MKRRWWLASGVMWFGLGLGIAVIIEGVNSRMERVPVAVEMAPRTNDWIEPTITKTPKVIRLIAVGDVMLGRTVREKILAKQDWNWPWQKTAYDLKVAEVTVGNLESPIVTGCTQHQNRMIFCTNPEAVKGLKGAGFDVWTLANNHMLNYGQQGLEETRTQLKAAGMEGTYGGELVVKLVEGVRLGFMGYDDVSQPLNLVEVEREVAEARSQVDWLAVMPHWGSEYMASPSARQREVAEAFIRGGAEAIIGSHPHWVQPTERVGKTLVFWSLGNFVFDQMWSEETRKGVMVEVEIIKTAEAWRAGNYSMRPVKIYEFGQPTFE